MSKKLKILVVLAVFSGGILLISNLVATKIWNFFGIPVDGGIICFPISYIVSDLIIEFSDKKTARTIVFASFGLNIFAIFTFFIVGVLPVYDGWNLQKSYNDILGFVPRIALGSLIAFVFSSLCNNAIFEKIKRRTGERKLFYRALGSSVLAHVVDSLIFETVAFLGVLEFCDFLKQTFFAYIFGITLETILFPITAFIVKLLRNFLFEKEAPV